MTKQRKRIKFEGQWYKPVPWLKPNECDGCAMQWDSNNYPKSCINDVWDGEPCANEFAEKVFIRCGSKEALAEYIARKLEGNNDKE